MFEYANPGLIIFGSITSVMLLLLAILQSGKAMQENRKTKAPYLIFVLIALIIAGVIADALDTKNRVKNNITIFKRGGELTCPTFGTNYLVSSETGWKLHKESFLKDSILVDVKFCGE